MPPHHSEPTAPDRGPRHASEDPRRNFGADAYRRTFPANETTSSGRHRRPESLADDRQPWAATAPSPYRRFTDARFAHAPIFDAPVSGTGYSGFSEAGFSESGFSESAAGDFIERGFPEEPTRAQRRHAEAIRMAEQRRRDLIARAQQPARRGRHSAQSDLAITVRPAGQVQSWAVYASEKPPVIGSHRAPGTLPIESWLLVGKTRQQALLASLVAAGLALVMIPIQRNAPDSDAVNAADRSVVGTTGGERARGNAPGAANKPGRRTPAGNPAGNPVPTGSAPAPTPPSGSTSTEPPLLAVPPGTGPAHSLRVTGSETVALTFDDGPDPVQTPKILELLAKYDVTATFCLVGQNAQKHPEIVRQIVAAGHTLCNHTWSHSLTIGTDKPEQIQADLARTNAAIRAAVPGVEIPFFRAPGGFFTDRLVSEAYGDGMTSLYWDVDPKDWKHNEDADGATHTDRVIADVQKSTKPGSIILSHDFNQPDTVAAYEKLLPWLTDRFETGLAVPPPMPDDPEPPAVESAVASEPPATPADPR